MKKNSLIFALGLVALTLSSCDDGDIQEKVYSTNNNGRVIKLTGKINGIKNWSSNYSVALAGFGESNYSIVQKNITASDNGDVELTLSVTSNEIKTIELCVTNILRERILTFKSMDVPEGNDSILFNVGEQNVGMFHVIQQEIFNSTCLQCHGGSNTAAAGLYLTEEKSHEALVRKPSTKVEGGTLVIPGDSKNSVLHRVLNKGGETGLKFNHEDMINTDKKLQIIDDWIDHGANE
ncbi:MAG: hypothetical protein NC206_05970 [Bacteroides sp.]|nr:hypothetical protein [Roseburia sp.]MCM1346613.1 hypothetical protein [Bacteroides sp.]MCM1421143.1 hypothetical protein [Bacteroides sp.]